MADLWRAHGRCYYSRHDYEDVDADKANAMIDRLRGMLANLSGQSFAGLTVEWADEFAYDDPVDGSRSEGQGLRIGFEGGGRAVFRLSGTGTVGATIRRCLENLETDPDKLHLDPEDMLASINAAALELSDLKAMTGRNKPDVIT